MIRERDPRGERGFILIFTILMLLGISALAVGMVYNAHHGRIAAQNYKNRIRAFYASDGMRALLAQEVLDGNAKRYLDVSIAGVIKGDVYEGAGGGIDVLKGAMGGTPAHVDTSDYLGSNWKGKSNYGVRWRGYVIPPATGPYTFFVRADDEGELYLSPDDNPANLPATPIAKVSSWSFTWPKWGPGVSKPVSLKIGQRYYFEFLHTQSVGPGYGQVGWSGPNYLFERPISGKRLAAYGSKTEKWDTTKVGRGRVKYALAEAGPLVFTLNTEAIMGGKGDTTFRSPLSQTLSMRGDNPAPPESLWQRVIFYDFHSNGSNPEFDKGECCFFDGEVTPGMVRAKGLKYTTTDAGYFGLDSIGKPMLGPNVKYDCGIDNWFRAWKPGWAKWYNYTGGGADCSTVDTPGSDSAFKNVVIKDSLLFTRRSDLGANVYQFKRFGDPEVAAFMPLDGKGFGDEGATDKLGVPHNYSFCMELHTKFEHTSGMNFEFNGDDDVWLYINDSLVMDLGFVHKSTYATVNLDDLPLTFGETYPLDFFYCERQRVGSSIDLITNLPVLLKAGKPSSSWKRDYGNTD
jgi:fibro-slime domain-containing protein